MRYDAAIIGAGANGLAAAATLGRAGLKVIVLERAGVCGGRAATREFHPGFRASPFIDELAAIPPDIFRDLDLARHGAILIPQPSSLALWPDRRDEVSCWNERGATHRLSVEVSRAANDLRAKAFADASVVRARRWFRAKAEPAPWPPTAWSTQSLAEACDLLGKEGAAHLAADVVTGRAVDPFLYGSALKLLTAASGGATIGGLGTLGSALTASAQKAGAEISTGLEVVDITVQGRAVIGLHLADGTRIEARAVISTLDLRRTFFSLFAWQNLPAEISARVSSYRQAAGRSRLLLALDAPPVINADFRRGPIHVAPDLEQFARAHDAWRSGVVPESPPLSLRLVSATDPGLAPEGKAVLTATLGCIPAQLFDGAWTNEKRTALRDHTIARIEAVLPGITASIVGSELILPHDIEDELGVTAGDLDGGEIAPDQMFALRGFSDCSGGRTPLRGLYLGGMSSPAGPLGTCVAGVTAARAVLADLNARLLR